MGVPFMTRSYGLLDTEFESYQANIDSVKFHISRRLVIYLASALMMMKREARNICSAHAFCGIKLPQKVEIRNEL